jgi:hypothetical protein
MLGSLAAGIGLDQLQDAHPFLTETHIESAQVFALGHPGRGRSRRMADLSPSLEPRITRALRHARGA